MVLNKNIKAFLYSWISVLLGLSIVFNLSFNAFHSQSEDHNHSEKKCSVEKEFDACHRYLFHHEKSAQCNGSHQHINNKESDCFACTFFKHKQQIIESKKEVCFLTKRVLNLFSIPENYLKTSFLTHVFLRGPPSVS